MIIFSNKLESLGLRASWECNWKPSVAGFSTRAPPLPGKRRHNPLQARIVVLFCQFFETCPKQNIKAGLPVFLIQLPVQLERRADEGHVSKRLGEIA
jgi:hypothetical protein